MSNLIDTPNVWTGGTINKPDDMVVGWTFEVPGPPSPKKRPRVVRTRGGGIHSYTPDDTLFLPRVAAFAKQAGVHVLDGPVEVNVHVLRAIPASASNKRRAAMMGQPAAVRPDGVNVLAAVWDALIGIAYHDDAQVAHSRFSRSWAAEHKTVISIRSWTTKHNTVVSVDHLDFTQRNG